MLNSPSISTTDLAEEICKFMLENVTAAKVKTKKNIQDQNQKSKPWFDMECKLKKDNLRGLAKKLTKSPSDNNIRSQVSDARKSFKNIILAKKRRHRKNLVDELKSKKEDRNLKEFWKLFRKISPKNESDPRQPSMNEFRNYFEKLSYSSRSQDMPFLSQETGPLDFSITSKELLDASKTSMGKLPGWILHAMK